MAAATLEDNLGGSFDALSNPMDVQAASDAHSPTTAAARADAIMMSRSFVATKPDFAEVLMERLARLFVA